MSAVGDFPGLVQQDNAWTVRCTACPRTLLWRVRGGQATARYGSKPFAAERARDLGWLVLHDRCWCPACRTVADCRASGHRFGEWLPGPFGPVRLCGRCPTLEFARRAVDWDGELRRLTEEAAG